MAITRRQFLKYAAASAAALGLSELELFKLTEKVMAISASKPRVIALQGQACSGDITSLANLLNSIPPDAPGGDFAHTIRDAYSATVEEILGVNATFGASPTSTVDDVLIDLIDLTFHPTICAPAGAQGYVEGVINQAATPGYIVLVEGSVPIDGDFNGQPAVGADSCKVGDQNGIHTGSDTAETLVQALTTLCDTTNCAAVIAVGTCAAFGGIPAANNANDTYRSGPNFGNVKYKSSGAASVAAALQSIGGDAATRPVVNVSGCPIRPDDLFLTVAQAIIYGVPSFLAPGFLTADGRPKSVLGINLFGQTHHYHCSRKSAYTAGNFATSFADTDGKCLSMLGCKGQSTFASCQRNKKHQWNPTTEDGATGVIHDTTAVLPWSSQTLGCVTNNGGTSCVKKGHPCIGCKEKGFPDRFSPLVNYNN
ncbi:MAG: twin-arginine translocation signal domain-containing protein [Actinobacteria bacterium]|nr:MAG: twin-arginine translocation signal domain-containing protein [Actinomycetota bacterium]